MTAPRPASPGDTLDRVETPALVVDLDALEANIAAMASRAKAGGMALRPHAKTHKSAEIAKLQLAAGAIGICAQKVSEAEALLGSGVKDVLISNHILGEAKLDRLCGIAKHVRVTTLTSDAAHVAMLSQAAARNGAEIEILIEIDAGDARMGLQNLNQVGPLAQAIDKAPGLRFRGLQAYTGPFQHIRDPEERADAALASAEIALEARDAILALGLSCETITGGGTGSFDYDLSEQAFTEIQPGSYVFMDMDYGRNEDGPSEVFRQSLFVLASVIRVPEKRVVYVDAGVKSLNLDSGMPGVHERTDLAFTKASDEQGRVEIATKGQAPKLGERLLLVPSHCDPTVNQFDWMVAVRNGRVEHVWPVDARGCVI
ncbi:DSD1 family PLP-dependent enzyme [Flaviflagellibacter deserti]|uniref:DSD1 family PLP-dependent enzyme n=1 Tax=Flaviflagellibacter deserti TaxID=2267266 RepID=A0ABV9Z7N0_9HYPH